MPNPRRFLHGLRWLVAAAAATAHGGARAEDVVVAVAANFAAPMRVISAAFERETGHRVVMALGSTGSLYAQIKHGAPFQVLLAADMATPQRLEREALAVPGTRITYATGRLALWSARPEAVDPEGRVLTTGRLDRIALANPRMSPYGVAALQTMDRLGLPPLRHGQWVQGESVGQVHQFVASGNAPLGFVAWAQIQTDGRLHTGSAWLVPAHLHDPIRQDAALLMPGRGRQGAQAFMAFLRSASALAIIRAHGYSVSPA